MDGASDAASWLYEQGKAAFDRREYATALENFEFCLSKLRTSHVRCGGTSESFNSARTAFRHLDDYLELCRTRNVLANRQSPLHATGNGSVSPLAAPGQPAEQLVVRSPSKQSSSPLKLQQEPSWQLDEAPLVPLGSGQQDSRTTLIMVCSPKGSPLPHLADEAVDVANVTPSHIRRGGSAEELRHELLRHRYRAFLFAGHGDAELGPGGGASWEKPLTRTLGFTSPSGGLETVRPEHLAELLGAHSPRSSGCLTTVFLNGCRTEEMGRRVRAAGVPHVVCWRTKAHNAAARTLASSFFSSLAAGRGHAQAFEDAKSAVLLVTRPGRLANGVPSSVPAYELRDPFAQTASEATLAVHQEVPPDFSPPPMAAGIPILLSTTEGATTSRV